MQPGPYLLDKVLEYKENNGTYTRRRALFMNGSWFTSRGIKSAEQKFQLTWRDGPETDGVVLVRTSRESKTLR